MNCLPCWTDLSPRVGASYDLFGNGRTALKMSWGRYVGKTGTNIAQLANPINTSVSSVTRTWTDINRNYVPGLRFAEFRSAMASAGRFGQQFRAEQPAGHPLRRRCAPRLRRPGLPVGHAAEIQQELRPECR